MYDKELARKIHRLLKKKCTNIIKADDVVEAAFTASEMMSMLDLFAEVIKLDIETINVIKITKEG